MEVNHIAPRNGGGYGTGCHNHLSNLETLCHLCHVQVTKNQRIEFKKGVDRQMELSLRSEEI